MKLEYVRLSDKGMQTEFGRLRDVLAMPWFELTLISNLRAVKARSRDWDDGKCVYIPLERLDNFSPLLEPSK